MTREVKIGTAVAGSFLSLVGIVVATKMYKGDIPKVIDGVHASADVPKKEGDPGVKPDATPGILPTSLVGEMPPASFPPPSPPVLPPGSPLPPLPGAPAFPDSKGSSLPTFPDARPIVDAGNDAARRLQDAIAKEKENAANLIGKTNNDLNNAATSIINSAANQGENAIRNLVPKDLVPPGSPTLPMPAVSLPGGPPVIVADNNPIVGGVKPPAPTPPTPTPAPAPGAAPLSLPTPPGLPGVPEVPLAPGSTPPSAPLPPVATPPGAPVAPPVAAPVTPPVAVPLVGAPAAAPLVGDPVPKSNGPLPPVAAPPGFPTPPAPPAGLAPVSPPAGNPFPPVTPLESPATPIVGTPPTPAPPVSVRPEPQPPVGAPTPPFGTPAPTPPPPPFGGAPTPPTPPAPPGGVGFVPVTPPMPPLASPGQPQVKTDTPERYLCQATDTFASLSVRKYGNENYARALEEYNRDMPGAPENLRSSPARLVAGTYVWLPSQNYLLSDRYARFVTGGSFGSTLPNVTTPVPANTTRPLGSDVGISPPTPVPGGPAAPRPPANDVGVTTYRVPAGGQYFSQIAEARLGNPLRWIDIYRLNLGFPPEQPIREGTEIRIPVK